ncbi:MAG: hypothetical protein HY689_11085 [Chloroflexi bacterium]|nr:hypothetical protein [Chloroflexota bacterium]
MSRRILENPDAIRALAERLARCPQVARFDQGNEQEGWTLAHSFADLEESFRKFLDEQLPKLAQEQLSASEISGLLLDMGEEFRHILYHISDPAFYKYLHQEDEGRKRA